MRHQRDAARLILPLNLGLDTVIIPNGTIQKMRSFTKLHAFENRCSYLREKLTSIWLAQNAETMRQDTDDLWQARKDLPFTAEQFEPA